MEKQNKKIIFITSLIIGFIIVIFSAITGIKLYINHQEKNNGTLYIVIKQYEVEDEHFKVGDDGQVIFRKEFTDELYYHEKIISNYGYNEVLIENGVARVIDANCPNPHTGSGCMNGFLTNKTNFLDKQIICCYKHGISLSWEVVVDED